MKIFVLVAFLLIGTLFHHGQAAAHTRENWLDFRRKCLKILGSTAEIRQQFENSKDYISDEPEMHCLVRCVGILSEIYDDETGTNWDLMAHQLEGKEGFEEHRQATTECVEALPQEVVQSDVCRRSYLSFRCVMESAKRNIRDKN